MSTVAFQVGGIGSGRENELMGTSEPTKGLVTLAAV
jgi:hypothetical protein